ncbi:Syntaphilin [Camelus dromedarius]|uniref:Syntaphilin n=1 Tax=Camelus dromedarius TaxID=9838 RepID=A0A5N4CTR6_CAMDR|nr:Syntaphilin [Camelus dromedarius]
MPVCGTWTGSPKPHASGHSGKVTSRLAQPNLGFLVLLQESFTPGTPPIPPLTRTHSLMAMSLPGSRRASAGSRRRTSPPVSVRDAYGTSSLSSSSNSGSCKGSDSSPTPR